MKAILSDELIERAQHIKWFFTDVDGTLTDGTSYYSPSGEVLKRFSLRDGSGFFLLHQIGIKIGIITGENSPIVERRAEKLKVDKLVMNAVPKLETFQRVLDSENLSMNEVAYIGDGINDVKLLKVAGLSFAVADAHETAKNVSSIVLNNNGGNGAFLEACEILIRAKGISVESIVDKSL